MPADTLYRNGNATWRVVDRVSHNGADYVIAERDVVPAWCNPRGIWPLDVWQATAREVVA